MTAPQLRPYQSDTIARLHAEAAGGRRRILIVAPTGSGKTVIAGALIAEAVSRRQRVLFLAHRRELIQQASAKLHGVSVDHGIVQAGFPTRPGEPVQIGSVQTLHARAVRSTAMEMPPAEVVVVDEAHHVRARTYQQILRAYPGAIIIGLTATPCRGDGRGLGDDFEVLIESASVAQLIEGGYLVPTKVYAPSEPDLKGIKIEKGDYAVGQLEERVNRPKLVGDIVEHWLRLAERRPTVVFATGVSHSVAIRDEFRQAGVLAEHLDGTTPATERDSILAKLAAGTVEVVTNAMVLTEGWDCPSVSCAVLGRPTKQLGFYRQMVGRILRPAPGKTDALILDHAGSTLTLGFVEDEITWTLKSDERAENKKNTARKERRAPTLATCPECSAVKLDGSPCSICGWRPQPKPVVVAVKDGELGHMQRDRSVRPTSYSPDDKRRTHAMLAFIARERGYKAGWVSHKYREKFGTWPDNRWVDPIVPDDAIRAWVRSRQIAYAKGAARRSA